MTFARRTAAALVPLLVLATACSDRPAAEPSANPEGVAQTLPDGTPAPSDPQTTAPGSGSTPSPGKQQPRESGGTPGASSTASSAPSSPTTVAPQDGEPYGNTNTPGFPLHVEITPKCIKRGTRVTAKVTTRPYAAIAAAVAYSDNAAHGAYNVGAADPTGSWAWTFVVSPEAPYGRAQMLVAAQDRSADSNDEGASSNEEGAGKKYYFEVKKAC